MLRCWSFCSYSCILRKLGACRKIVPAFQCDDPNNGQTFNGLILGDGYKINSNPSDGSFLWDSDAFRKIIIGSDDIIRAVKICADSSYQKKDRVALAAVVMSMWTAFYTEADRVRKMTAVSRMSEGSRLIADWLCEQSCLDPDEWVKLYVRAARNVKPMALYSGKVKFFGKEGDSASKS